MANGFWKIRHINDWGADAWFTELRSERSSIGEQDRRCRLIGGTVVDVLWPDRNISTCKLSERRYRTTVSDHGSTYDVMTSTLRIPIKFNGKSCHLEIDDQAVERLRFRIVRQPFQDDPNDGMCPSTCVASRSGYDFLATCSKLRDHEGGCDFSQSAAAGKGLR